MWEPKTGTLASVCAGAALAVMSAPAHADEVHADDVIVQGRLCVGGDSGCVNGENFGTEDLRIKSSSPQVRFEATGSSPSDDWSIGGDALGFSFVNNTDNTIPVVIRQTASTHVLTVGKDGIGVNTPIPATAAELHLKSNFISNIRMESGDSGENIWTIGVGSLGMIFSDVIESPSVNTPVWFKSGAPDDSLVVGEFGGRAAIGVGTDTPIAELHLDGGSSTADLLLEGFDGQGIWNINSGKLGLFFNTIGGQPLKLFNNAPSNSVVIASDGQIGMGTDTPDARLHIATDGEAAIIKLQHSNTATPTTWEITNNANNGRLTIGPTGGNNPFKFGPNSVENLLRVGIVANDVVDVNGDIQVNGDVNITGNCVEQNGACADYVFEAGYKLPSLDELRSFIDSRGHLPNVPSTEQIKKNGVNITHFSGRLLEKIEELTLYTLQQQQTIDAHKATTARLHNENQSLKLRLANQEADNRRVNARLARIERLLSQ